MGILSWIIFGLIAGILAKWIMPGKDGGGFFMTILLGIVGAVVGGWISTLFGFGKVDGFNFGSFVVAVIGAANQRRCFIFAALAGTYHHAVFMLTEAADFGVIDNLAASGLENFCHRRRYFAVADNAAGRHKNTAKPGDIRFALAQFIGV